MNAFLCALLILYVTGFFREAPRGTIEDSDEDELEEM